MYNDSNEKLIDNISLKNTDRIPPLSFGKVIQNYDEQHPKKVKVQLRNSMGSENNEIWADVLFSYAGDEYGEYAVPEIDSEVLVAFAMNNRNFPVILGNIRPPDKKIPPDTSDKDNCIKSFVTKAGNKITVNDKNNETSVCISTSAGLTISFNDKENMISVSDSDSNNKLEMDFKNKTVSVDAGNSISLKINNTEAVKIDKQSVEIKTKEFTVKADSKISLSGGQISADGTALNLKSNGNVSLKANGNLSAEASGMAKVKGSLLNLN